MSKKAIDHLYTARWAVGANRLDVANEELTKALVELGGLPKTALPENAVKPPKEQTGSDKELPNTSKIQGVFVLKVGHLATAKGAAMVNKIGPSEYDYYKNEIVPRALKYAKEKYPKIKLHIVYRDGTNISGAYANRIRPLNPDGVIELHYNAAGASATGTETLCSNDVNDRRFAEIVQKKMCQVFGRSGMSRGVKVIARNVNGGTAVHALPGIPNCLIEPAFGSNVNDAKLLMSKRQELAECLVESFIALMS